MYLRVKQNVDQATGEEDLNPSRSSAEFIQDVGGELSGARNEIRQITILFVDMPEMNDGKEKKVIRKVWSLAKWENKQMQAGGLMCNSDLSTGFPPKDNEGSGMCAKCKK